jgi:hypothetical protein
MFSIKKNLFVLCVTSIHLKVSRTGRVKPKTIKLVFTVSPLSTKHYAERAKNQDNVSEWGDMSIRRLLFSELEL